MFPSSIRALPMLCAVAVVALAACGGTAATPAPRGSAASSASASQSAAGSPSVAASASAAISPSAAASGAGGSTVTIANFAFAPVETSVKVGTKVTWKNDDSTAHTATADDGTFDTKRIEPGQSGSSTMSKAGTFTYHCELHPNMKATITVTE